MPNNTQNHEGEGNGMPLPSPRSPHGDNDHLLHSGAPRPDALALGLQAFDDYRRVAETETTEAEREALRGAIMRIQQFALEELQKALPKGMETQDRSPPGANPDEVVAMYPPHVTIAGLTLMCMSASQMLDRATVPERCAYMSEFVRTWASAAAYEHVRGVGIHDPQKIAAASGVKLLVGSPPPMGMYATLSAARHEAKAEAAAAGVSLEEYVKSKRDEIAARINGDDDDRMAF